MSFELPSTEEDEGDDPVRELMAAAFMFDVARVYFRGSIIVTVLESAPFSVSSSPKVSSTRKLARTAPMTSICRNWVEQGERREEWR